MFRANVHNLSTENVDQLANFGASPLVCAYLDQHQVTLNEVLLSVVFNFDDRHQFFELFADLINHFLVAVYDERDSGEPHVFSRTDRKAVDIERS